MLAKIDQEMQKIQGIMQQYESRLSSGQGSEGLFNRSRRSSPALRRPYLPRSLRRFQLRVRRERKNQRRIEAEDRPVLELRMPQDGFEGKRTHKGSIFWIRKERALDQPSDNGVAKNKKGRFSFLQKAKTWSSSRR